jgi:hypothetical protein
LVVITCPACAKSVQLPDDMLGQSAVCPYCKSLFTAPVRQDDGALSAPVLRRTNPFANAPTRGPGLMMVLIGCVSLLFNGVEVGKALLDPAGFEAHTRGQYAQDAEIVRKAELKGKDESDPAVLAAADAKAADYAAKGDFTARWLPVTRGVFMALGLLTTLGGIAMFQRKWHPLAMLGSVAAMFNVMNYCCIPGMPVGGYSLYLLMNPAVRDTFTPKKQPPAPPPS